MKLLIKYIDFHWDNYQGGSGKTIYSTLVLDVPDALPSGEIFEFIHKKFGEHINERRPFDQSRGEPSRATIRSVELV